MEEKNKKYFEEKFDKLLNLIPEDKKEEAYTCVRGIITGMESRIYLHNAHRESRIAEIEESFKSLFDRLPSGVYRTTPDGKIIDCNPAMIDLLGYPDKNVFLRKNAEDIFVDVNNRRAYAELMKKNGLVRNFEYQLKKFDGTVIWVSDSSDVVYDKRGYIRYYEGVMEDITERKNAEQALKESEEKYRLLIEHQNDLVVQVDTEGRFMFVSPSYCELFGKTKEELLGSRFMPLVHADDREHTSKAMEALYEPPYYCYIEQRALTKYGWRWLAWSDNAIFDENRNIVKIVGVGRDITDRVEAENALKDSESKLKELNATKDMFFSIIAHDLMNPFNALIGSSRILEENFDNLDDNDKMNIISDIRSTSTSIQKLIENLLQWARAQTGTISFHPEVIFLKEPVSNTLFLLKQLLSEKKIRINQKISKKIKVYADMNMLMTIIRNLLTNAVKFTPEGGSITLTAKESKGMVEASIKDTGIGIRKSDLDKLFRIDVHHSTIGTSKEKGTGLGLILCKEFIVMNGGDIWAESDGKTGSVFRFTLPAGL